MIFNDYKRDGPKTVCWFSCGAASAVAAKITIDSLGCDSVEVVYCDTSDSEHEDNMRFLLDVERWIGKDIRVLKSLKFKDIDDVFAKRRYMSGMSGAPCTVEMKKKVRFNFQLPMDIHVFGMTSDEINRAKRFAQQNMELYLHWPLIEHKLNKDDCLRIINDAGIDIPAMYKLGYKNNNCKGCVKATSPSYWNKVRVDFPEIFELRARQSREYGARLTRLNGQRIFLDELPASSTEVIIEDLSCGPQCGAENNQTEEAVEVMNIGVSEQQADLAIKHLAEKPRNEKAPVYFDSRLGKTVIRNSKVGACPREIWAFWKGMEPASSGFSPRIGDDDDGLIQSDPMEEGHLHEAAIKQKLIEKGWKLDGFESEFTLQIGSDCMIIGHADMISAICPVTGIDYIGEIKTMGKDAMADFIENGWARFPTYPVQISVAMIATKKPGIMWIKNRDNGRILAPIIFDTPPVSRLEITRKVLKIREFVLSDKMPPCGTWRKNSPWCRFTQLHQDEAEEISADAIVRPDLEAIILEYQELGRTNKAIGEDEDGNLIKEKSRREELREMIMEAMGESKRLVAGSVGIAIGESKFGFDESKFKLDYPELWNKYRTKEKAGSFRVIKIKGQ